jgi:hypothetical protein
MRRAPRDANPKAGLCVTAVVLTGLLCSCSLGRVNERMAYWTSETHEHLVIGSSVAEAQRFFEARGITLTCCVSGPPGAERYYYAVERKVGSFLLTDYDVAILVALGSSKEVQAVRVERWGFGL